MVKAVYPKYVEHGGELSYPGPVVCEGANLYGFILEGDPDKLTALCRRFFHDPSGGRVDYIPLSRFIMLTLGTIQKISSSSMDLGWSTETQAVFWVPTARGHQEGSVFFADQIAMLPAYVVVDAFYSLASGREVYGFFKSFGWFDMPAQAPVNPDRIGLDVYGLKEFNPANEAKRWPLLEVSRCGDGSAGTSTPWTSLEDAFQEIKSTMQIGGKEILLPGLKLVPSLIHDLLHKEVPLVFLKQFRAADHPDGAAYQAILEAPTVVQRFNGFNMLDEYQFTLINNLASYPLTNDLGITSQKAALSFKLDMDFIIPGGPTIWQSTEPQPTGLLGFLQRLFGVR
jgi:hypothetical protein